MGVLKLRGKSKLPQWALAPVVVQREVRREEEPATPPDAPQTLPWRRRLAGWPEEWRERWGRLANALEDRGLGWREAEERAWVETLKAKREVERAGERVAAKVVQTTFKESA